MRYLSLISVLILFSVAVFAQRGKDGSKTVTTTEVVNEYTTLTANATVGATSISVTSSSLNGNGRFSGTLAAGDLIMIIQMQGADTKVDSVTGNPWSTPSDTAYGRILAYNNCGNHELVQVGGVPNGTTINLDCPLKYAYNAAGRVQVIRVPRYAALTINNSGTLRADPWNGSTGGVLAMEVLGNTVINGTINLRGQGFRGGQRDSASVLGGGFVGAQNSDQGAEKVKVLAVMF